MTWQILWSIAAAAAGFASAVWFGAGALLINAEEMVRLADPPWKAARDTAFATASQAAQYLAGALLLLVSFVLQVVAVQASAAIVPGIRPTPLDTFALAACLAVGFLEIGDPIFVSRKRYLQRRISQLLPARP